jgi:ribosome modulation factor
MVGGAKKVHDRYAKLKRGDFIEEGVEAYCSGQTRTGCPYAQGTDEHGQWTRGWCEAEDVDLADRVIDLADHRDHMGMRVRMPFKALSGSDRDQSS